MRDFVQAILVDVETVSLRAVPGEGDQAELTVKTRRGELSFRLIARPGKTLRVMDLRARDKKRKPGERRLLQVPMADVMTDAVRGGGRQSW